MVRMWSFWISSMVPIISVVSLARARLEWRNTTKNKSIAAESPATYKHTWVSFTFASWSPFWSGRLSVSVSLCLSVSLSVCRSVCLSLSLSVSLSMLCFASKSDGKMKKALCSPAAAKETAKGPVLIYHLHYWGIILFHLYLTSSKVRANKNWSHHKYTACDTCQPCFKRTGKNFSWMSQKGQNQQGWIPGSRGIVQSCVLTYSKLKRGNLW